MMRALPVTLGKTMSKTRSDLLVGAIEGGGTKFVCAVGSGPDSGILARESFSTGDDPAKLLSTVARWLKQQASKHGKLGALGVASFGPVDLDEASPTYGCMTSTPKPGWANTDVLSPLAAAFPGVPVGFDTDTNAAALGEHHWGNGQGFDDFVYITIGTGIGAGVMVGGHLQHGLIHPEFGHVLLPALANDDFGGVCPYHGRCLEGLCSGPALELRTGMNPEELPSHHDAWRTLTHYIGVALANVILTVSPKRIIIGGSVRKAGHLGEKNFFRLVQSSLLSSLNGYLVSPRLTDEGIRSYLVPPLLGDDAGVCGAIALAQCAASRPKTGIQSADPA
jgi:fructokinase